MIRRPPARPSLEHRHAFVRRYVMAHRHVALRSYARFVVRWSCKPLHEPVQCTDAAQVSEP